jgi:hypothetical protein
VEDSAAVVRTTPVHDPGAREATVSSEFKIALWVVLIIFVGLPVLDVLLTVLGVGSLDLLSRMGEAAKRMGYRASGRSLDEYDDSEDRP